MTTLTASPADEGAPVPDRWRRRARALHRRLWRHRQGLSVSLLLAGLAVGGALGFGFLYFRDQADRFDLRMLAEVERGVKVVGRDGREIGVLSGANRKLVALDEVPDHLVDALVATEDSRFFEHGGLDWRGVARAAVANFAAMGIEQGGSTITQQLARQTFGLSGRTFARKFTEAFAARRIERSLSKDVILERYLNRIYLGEGYYGIGAAARGYFGKDVAALAPHESALIVGIIKAPSAFSPRAAPELARRARNLTIGRMATLGMIGEDARDALQAKPLGVASRSRNERPSYLLAGIGRELRDVVSAPGAQDGYRVATRAIPELQDAVRRATEDHLAAIENRFGSVEGSPLQAAVVVLDNASGAVLASLGGRDFRASQFDRAWSARRPAGTAFEPWVYAAAFQEEVLEPFDRVLDIPLDNEEAMVGGTAGTLGEWGAEDLENRYEGEVSAAYALMAGKNAAAVRTGNQAGTAAVRKLAAATGIHSELRDFPALFLGESEVGVAELASAASVFPRGGMAPPPPHFIGSVSNADGRVLFERETPEPARVLDAEVAAEMVEILRAKLARDGVGESLRRFGLEPSTLAGFGGTAHGFTDAWFLGFSRDVTCAVWVGSDAPRPIGERAFSREVALPLWAATMASYQDLRRRQLEAVAPADTTASRPVPLCLRSGMRATLTCRAGGGAVVIPSVALARDASASPRSECSLCVQPDDAVLTATGDRLSPGAGTPPATGLGAKGVQPKAPVVLGLDDVGSFFW